ncbi:transcriptional repressor [Bengtsoniella intestinalis]|uniref:Fur family transcriptional regulator n=1 Tax=Bengtsoniella intestinalis TaxID=3073143 RepID=UPI00391EEDEB
MAYQTKQLQALIDCLAKWGQRPVSAAQLRGDLQAMGKPVSLATIYRQLDRLAQGHQLHKIVTPEGSLFQYCPHHEGETAQCLIHCQGCGQVSHLDCHEALALFDHLSQHHGFQVDPALTQLTGTCAQCQGKESL